MRNLTTSMRMQAGFVVYNQTKQINKIMTDKNKMYLSPETEVVEVTDERVYCTSGNTEDLENGGVVDWFEE